MDHEVFFIASLESSRTRIGRPAVYQTAAFSSKRRGPRFLLSYENLLGNCVASAIVKASAIT